MIIVTDIDECVLSWGDAFFDWLSTDKELNIENKWREHIRVEEWMIEHDGQALINEFNQSGKFQLLKPTAKAEIFIPILHSMGHQFVALTACGTSDKTKSMRTENLKIEFGDIFSNFIAVNSGAEKEEYLKNIAGDIWVEDNFKNASYGPIYGYDTFIIDYYHNQSDEKIDAVRVSDWEDIYESIINR